MNHNPRAGIIMGSQSDLDVMNEAANLLKELGISYELNIISAHRTPHRMVEYAEAAAQKGIQVIIAGAGGAAHLPGMVASLTPLPVVGVPIKSSQSLDGWDSVLSILQMPGGIPVATVALNNGRNAGLLAARMLGMTDMTIQARVTAHMKQMAETVQATASAVDHVYSAEA